MWLLDLLNKRKGEGTADMSFLEHIEELRWHIARSLAAILIAAVVLFLNKSFLFDTIILGPMHTDFPAYVGFCKLGRLVGMGDSLCTGEIHFKLMSMELTSQFMIHMKAAFMTGLILVFPYVLWEFWRFVSPALYETERRQVNGVVIVGSVLFYIGLLFGYYIIAPFTVIFLGDYQVSSLVTNTFSLDSYMDTVSGLSLTSGIVFEFPLIMYFLAKLGIVTDKFLKKYRKYAIVVCLFLAAIITPSPDMFSQTIVTLPLYGLYEVSVIVAARVRRNKEKKQVEEDLS
ncbi:MAG: twin-arginine translocase subunit TatC [Bacteroidota bacterium]